MKGSDAIKLAHEAYIGGQLQAFERALEWIDPARSVLARAEAVELIKAVMADLREQTENKGET